MPRGGEARPALVGAWRSNIQFRDGAFAEIKNLEFLYVFNAGGTMTESSNYDGVPPVPPAYGSWRETGPNQFEAVYVFYTTKAPANFEEVAKGGGWMPSGRGELRESITVAGDSLTSKVELVLFDQKGAKVDGGGKADGRGKRIR
jgi:hypothetical protein